MDHHRRPRQAALVVAALLALSPAAGRATASAATAPTAPTARASTRPHALVLPFIENDYTRAVAEARARKVPIFVEAWAPW